MECQYPAAGCSKVIFQMTWPPSECCSLIWGHSLGTLVSPGHRGCSVGTAISSGYRDMVWGLPSYIQKSGLYDPYTYPLHAKTPAPYGINRYKFDNTAPAHCQNIRGHIKWKMDLFKKWKGRSNKEGTFEAITICCHMKWMSIKEI